MSGILTVYAEDSDRVLGATAIGVYLEEGKDEWFGFDWACNDCPAARNGITSRSEAADQLKDHARSEHSEGKT